MRCVVCAPRVASFVGQTPAITERVQIHAKMRHKLETKWKRTKKNGRAHGRTLTVCWNWGGQNKGRDSRHAPVQRWVWQINVIFHLFEAPLTFGSKIYAGLSRLTSKSD